MKYRVIKDGRYRIYKYFPQYFSEVNKEWCNFEYMDCGDMVVEKFSKLDTAVKFIEDAQKEGDVDMEVVWQKEIE